MSVGVSSDVGTQDVQYLQKIVGLLVALGKKTQRECGDGIVTPGTEEGSEELLEYCQYWVIEGMKVMVACL